MSFTSRKTMSAVAAAIYLPEECWECVFRFLNNDHLESLSLVSKQFLSITNGIRFSLAIHDPTLPFLPRLLHRFPNLTTLDLSCFRGDLDALLLQISQYPLRRLTSLDLSLQQTFPANGLRALAEKTKTLTSLKCPDMVYLANADLVLITNCFPFLQELDLHITVLSSRVEPLPLVLHKLIRKVNLCGGTFSINDHELRKLVGLTSLSVDSFGNSVPASFIDSLVSLKSLTCLDFRYSCISDELLSSIAEEGLPLKKIVLDHCSNYTYPGISCLLSRCKFVQHLSLKRAIFLNDQLVAELPVFLGNLISIDISYCKGITESALFALIMNCSFLSDIKMETTEIGKKKVQNSNSFCNCCVNPQVKSLHLGWNSYLGDKIIKMLSLVCPNLEFLDLISCSRISEGGVVEVLRRCGKIRHLSISRSSGVKLHGMNFKVPNVEVLNLACSRIDDETLSVVSKGFYGLKYLDLNVTDKGVRQVVEKCKQLREINLTFCYGVTGDVVDWMVFSRPSLRKILAPPHFHSSHIQNELFLRHGCLVLSGR